LRFAASISAGLTGGSCEATLGVAADVASGLVALRRTVFPADLRVEVREEILALFLVMSNTAFNAAMPF